MEEFLPRVHVYTTSSVIAMASHQFITSVALTTDGLYTEEVKNHVVTTPDLKMSPRLHLCG